MTSDDADSVLRATLSASPMPMILTDPHQQDNPIVFCNQAFETLVGYGHAEIVGRNCRFLQGRGTDQATIMRIRAAIDARREIREDIYNYRKDGSGFWNALFISPVITSGRLLYFFASQLDVTQQHNAEIAMRRQERSAALQAITTGFAKFGSIVIDRNAAVSEISLLDSPVQSAGATEVVDLNELVAASLDHLCQVAGGQHPLSLNITKEALVTTLHRSEFVQALINLVQNARESQPQGGSIILETRLHTREARKLAEITVRDTGLGMSEKVLARATHPHFTTKANNAGLGLSQVSTFIDRADGLLNIASREGTGTTVVIGLPIHRVH